MDGASGAHHPWVGTEYRTAAQRVLLLGESHYASDGSDSPKLTEEIVGDVRTGARRLRFFTRAAALVGGPATSTPAGRAAFWDRVAFANYVPTVVGETADAPPTAPMWAQAAPRFFALLAALSPTHVLSLGQRQWNHIGTAFAPGWASVAATGAADPEIRRWVPPGGPAGAVTATWVNHPSRGFTVDAWRRRVAALLEHGSV